MKFVKRKISSKGIKITAINENEVVGRATLYIMRNDLHDRPFGLMEDVYVLESFRGQGIGSKLINKVIKEANIENCYKLIATSRYERKKVHDMYKDIGFNDYGKEFRINLN